MCGTSISLIHFTEQELWALWAASVHTVLVLQSFCMHSCSTTNYYYIIIIELFKVCFLFSCDRDKGGGCSLVGGMYVRHGRSASGLRPRPSAVPGDLLDGAAAVSQWLSRPGGFGPCFAEPVRSRERPPQQRSAALPAGQTLISCQTDLFMRLHIDAQWHILFQKTFCLSHLPSIGRKFCSSNQLKEYTWNQIIYVAGARWPYANL